MTDKTLIYTRNTPGVTVFTMPDGFESNVEVHVWGAGGGDGTGADGAGGGYAKSNVQINQGDTVTIIVGSQGQDFVNQQIGGDGGVGSTTLGFNGGRGANQGDPEDQDAGSAGGGGAATAVLVNGTAVAVGAGGGGGGGYGDDRAGGATPGKPGGESLGSAIFTALVVVDPRTGTSDHGYYTRTAAPESTVTNVRQYIVRLRGVTVWDSTAPPPSTYQAGVYQGTLYGIPGPGAGDNLNAFNLIVNNVGAWSSDTNGEPGIVGGGGGSGGGGGGYPLGGARGVSYGDDQQGSGGGGGGQNYGNITISGSGRISGGRSIVLAPASPPYGDAGYPGFAVLVLQRKYNVRIKDTTWKNVTEIYTKIGESRPSVTPVTVSYAGVGDTKILKTTVESSSYKVPPGVTSLNIDMIAHGGNASGNDDFGSPGGGSGGYYQGYTYAVTPGEVINYTVGGSGSNTVFGILTCTPGADGARGSIGLPGALGGSPNGTQGEGGGTPSTGARGGKGADSPFGTGGAGGVGGGPGSTGAAGSNATGYGAGGGGGGNNKGGGSGSPAFISITPVGLATGSFKVPAGVFTVTIEYLTPTGLQTHVQAVTPGDTIPVSVGDYGQESKFGSFTIPGFSKQVLRYRGNVDHLVTINVQVVTASGDAVSSSGYNAAQISAAAAAGITYSIPTEIYHGDLYSTIDFSPIRTSSVLNNIKLIGKKNSGRDVGPSITTQPTASNSYTAGVTLVYDPSSGEDNYDITLTLQQQGFFTVKYDLPIILSGWRKISQVFYKEGNEWKALDGGNSLPT